MRTLTVDTALKIAERAYRAADREVAELAWVVKSRNMNHPPEPDFEGMVEKALTSHKNKVKQAEIALHVAESQAQAPGLLSALARTFIPGWSKRIVEPARERLESAQRSLADQRAEVESRLYSAYDFEARERKERMQQVKEAAAKFDAAIAERESASVAVRAINEFKAMFEDRPDVIDMCTMQVADPENMKLLGEAAGKLAVEGNAIMEMQALAAEVGGDGPKGDDHPKKVKTKEVVMTM